VIKWPSQREKTPVTCGQDEVSSVVRFDRREGGKKVALDVEPLVNLIFSRVDQAANRGVKI
jgi:hypothetical protein